MPLRARLRTDLRVIERWASPHDAPGGTIRGVFCHIGLAASGGNEVVECRRNPTSGIGKRLHHRIASSPTLDIEAISLFLPRIAMIMPPTEPLQPLPVPPTPGDPKPQPIKEPNPGRQPMQAGATDP
jgi:hypothetical protein